MGNWRRPSDLWNKNETNCKLLWKKPTTPDETVNELWNPCKPLWTLNPRLELKLSDKRRSWNLTSTTWKSNLVTPTDKPLMLPRTSSSCKLKSRTLKPSLTKLTDDVTTCPNKWLLSNDDPPC